MKRFLIVIVMSMLVCGCGKRYETKSQLDDILEKGNYLIVDVRTKEEFSVSRIKESINIPYDEIDKNENNLDKDKTILVYCQSGRRSKEAYGILKDLGYDVIDLGGIDSVGLEIEYDRVLN